MSLKAFFPFFQHHPQLVYLDSAATTHKPESVLSAMDQFYRRSYGAVHRAAYAAANQASDLFYEARCVVQRFLAAQDCEEIVFTKGTTDGLNLLAQACGDAFIEAGDELLVSALEHHSNWLPWQRMCMARGAVFKVIPLNERGEITVDAVAQMITKRTKIITVAHISNVLGSISPIAALAQLAHSRGIILIVDGAQSVAPLPVDVVALDVDFFLFSAHKMYGPTGIGVCYGKKALWNQLSPVWFGGGMVDQVSRTDATFLPAPLGFEAGTPPLAEAIGLAAAIDFLQQYRADVSQASLMRQLEEGLARFSRINILGAPQSRLSVLTFTVEGMHAFDLGFLLDSRDIAVRTGTFCAQPLFTALGVEAGVRLSFGLYNTVEDVWLFLEALESIIKRFG